MESDYYNLEHNSFLSSEDREAIIRRKEELKQLNSENSRKVVMDLDVTNKAITGQKLHRSLETAEDPILQSILTNSKQNYVCSGVSDSNMEETLESLKGFVPRYRSELSDAPALDASALKDARQLLERKGRNSLYCIAFKEPLASLIAHGKQSHVLCQREIRHKGPVLIASLDENQPCPDYFDYPTTSDESGVSKVPRSKTPSILGKATLQDCMTWVEYNDEYPEGECSGVDDNFVLIFELQEAFTYPVPYSSPSEFYEIDRCLRR
uniref:Activating signal cointegrator 1 third domain-containing protein n=1 Tax=Ditylenchus dipsaci TaxID=166011 RepID=A0A915D0X2_9BILA